MTINCRLNPSALLRRKFSMICGENTTTQQAMDTDLWPRCKQGIPNVATYTHI